MSNAPLMYADESGCARMHVRVLGDATFYHARGRSATMPSKMRPNYTAGICTAWHSFGYTQFLESVTTRRSARVA